MKVIFKKGVVHTRIDIYVCIVWFVNKTDCHGNTDILWKWRYIALMSMHNSDRYIIYYNLKIFKIFISNIKNKSANVIYAWGSFSDSYII